MRQSDKNIRHAARVAVLCLEFVAEEVDAGRMQPETAAKAMRICAAYAKGHLPIETLDAWPLSKDYFQRVMWPEFLQDKTTVKHERVM